MANKHEFYTNQVCRFVSGSLTEKRTKDTNGRPLPEEKHRYEFGIALSKTDPDTARLFGEFQAFMQNEWANDQNKLNALANWFSPDPTTSMTGVPMKISDGDRPNAKGQLNSNTSGCFVFWFSTGYQPKCCTATNEEIPADAIKRGYYVQIAGNISSNGLPWQPDGKGAGIYMNPSVIRLVAEGDEIVGGVDAATAFGGTAAPTQLPPGARPVGSGVGMPGMATGGAIPPAPAPVQNQAAPAGLPGQATGQTAAPVTTVSPSNINPHTGILNGPGVAQPQTTPAGLPGQAAGTLPGLPGQQ